MAIAFVDNPISQGFTTTNPVTTSASFSASANAFYAVTIVARDTKDVVSITGGGLTWQSGIDGCGARAQLNIDVWYAVGTPADAFAITVSFDSTPNSCAIIGSGYSGVDQTTPTEDPVYQNTLGETGACTGGTDAQNLAVTTGSSAANYMHLVGFSGRDRVADINDGNFTKRGSQSAGTGGNLLNCEQADFLKAATGDTAFSASIAGAEDWVCSGLVLREASAGGTVNTKSGQHVMGLVTGGVDVHAQVETGAGVTGLVLGGTDVHAQVETGAAVLPFIAGGADVFVGVETGAAVMDLILGGTGRIVKVKSGQMVMDLIAAATDVHAQVETGAGVMGFVAGAADSHVQVETGAAITGLIAGGADVYVAVETGAVILDLIAGGAETRISDRTAQAVMGLIASGVDTTVFVEAGAPVMTLIVGGVDQFTAVEVGEAVMGLIAGGVSVHIVAAPSTAIPMRTLLGVGL